jgi:hypothetical protein
MAMAMVMAAMVMAAMVMAAVAMAVVTALEDTAMALVLGASLAVWLAVLDSLVVE